MVMMPRNLPEWETYIGRERPADVNRGLATVGAVAARLGVSRPAPRTLIIAGTNGKGSTAIFSEALLRARGYRVGTTLSPHLFSFNERMRIDGHAVDDGTVCQALEAVETARGDTMLSYFEYATLAALWLFRSSQVDVAVLEVGLGGRLDACNVVDGDVAVITSIGLDHQALLGSSRDAIGAEKAGILRRGAPLVYGEPDMPRSIAQRACALSVPVYQVGGDFASEPDGERWCFSGTNARQQTTDDKHAQPVVFRGLPHPRIALENAAVAVQAVMLLEVTGAAPGTGPLSATDVELACQSAQLAGRLQSYDVLGRTVIVDVAHNPHAAGFLARQLDKLDGRDNGATSKSGSGGRRTVVVAGILADKDAAGIVAALSGHGCHWVFTDTHGERGRTGADVAASLALPGSGDGGGLSVATELATAMARAVAMTGAGDRILIVGSFDIVQRASRLLAAGQAA